MTMLAPIHMVITGVFILGYLAIIFESYIKINKTASALLTAVITWALLFISHGFYNGSFDEKILNEHLSNASQIIFFLLGAMTLVEMIDIHKGFKIITDNIQTQSKRKMLWVIGIFAFFLSAVLDNLTTTILIVSLIRKIIPAKKDRALLGAAVVICANAGGAWTPIGDVTTTMLWIKGQVTTLAVMKSLFLPSFFTMLVALGLLSMQLSGRYEKFRNQKHEKAEPGARIVLICGISALMFVPIFRSLTGLPPFMGMLIGLGLLWLITDLMHHKYEHRKFLRIPHVLTRIDTSGVLFFLGILLCINTLEIIGVLRNLAYWLNDHIASQAIIAAFIGVLSSIVDNVPLVAACIGMYPLEIYPPDSALWQMIAYSAGTGGSILIIGSAAGVALMGLEKIDFIWYLRKVSLTALTSFLAGLAFYLVILFFL